MFGFCNDSSVIDFVVAVVVVVKYISGYCFTNSKFTSSTLTYFGANTTRLLTLFLSILRSTICF